MGDSISSLLTGIGGAFLQPTTPQPPGSTSTNNNTTNTSQQMSLPHPPEDEDGNVCYKILTIKLLDIRSGKALTHAKVKRLVIRADDGSSIGVKNQGDFYQDRSFIKKPTRPLEEAQIALYRLGYAENKDSSSANGERSWADNGWGEQSCNAFNAYWADRVFDANIVANKDTQPDTYYLNKIRDEYNSHAYTDEQGFIKLRIPKSFLHSRAVTVDIAFHDFCCVLEKRKSDPGHTLNRGLPTEGQPTAFDIDWKGSPNSGTQNIEWSEYFDGQGSYIESAHFGWIAAKGSTYADVKRVHSLPIKDSCEANAPDISTHLLSEHYHPDSSPTHFVLFAMVWAQPIWDGIDDGAVAGSITQHSMVQDSNNRGRNMHIPTHWHDLNGVDKYGGKGYGKLFNGVGVSHWRSSSHRGYDIHAQKGDFVFAIHSAKYSTSHGSLGGTTGSLAWHDAPGRRSNISYLHLQEHVANHHDTVIAGQVVAKAGRSGNLGDPSIWPGHVHINVGTPDTGTTYQYTSMLNKTLEDHYPDNQVVLVNNTSPLLLPCATEITIDGASLKNCGFTSQKYLSQCWAAAELKCPHMASVGQTDYRLQAQLRYLNEKPASSNDPLKENLNPEYYPPGSLNGDLGSAPSNIDVAGLSLGTVVSLTGNSNKWLIEISFNDGGGTKTGWVEKSIINEKNEIIVDGLLNFSSHYVGSTRMAIYAFRNNHNLISVNDYASNFSMDSIAWEKLNEVAAITVSE